MKKFYTLLVFIYITVNTYAQINFEYAKNFTYSEDSSGDSNDVTTDAFGNVYICGSFGGTLDFDPDPQAENLVSSETSTNIFLAKYDSNGNFVWVKYFTGTYINQALTIKTDAAGNCYFGAVFQETINYNYNGIDQTIEGAGQNDFFIAKIAPNGTYNWIKTFGGEGSEYCKAIDVSTTGEIIITGNYNTTLDFNPGEEVFNLTSQGSDDIFLLRLTTDGEFIWAKSFGGQDIDDGDAVSFDHLGYIYFTGRFRSTARFNSGTNHELISNGTTDVCVAKLDSLGQIIWINAFGGDSYDDSNSIIADVNGDVYVCGTFSTSLTFNTVNPVSTITSLGSIDAYIIKYNQDGTFNWVKRYGGVSTDRISKLSKKGNHLYGVAYFDATADFDPGESEVLFTPIGGRNTIIVDLNENGDFLWGGQLGGNLVQGNSINVDTNFNIYITGIFEGTNDLNPGAGIFEATPLGYYDFFLLKLSQPGIVSAPSFQASSVKLYPNPNNGTFSIEFNKAFPITQATIYNIAGQQVASQIFTNASVLQVDTQLSPGVYMVKTGSENNFTQTFKILVH